MTSRNVRMKFMDTTKSSKKILLVDDDPLILRMYQVNFVHNGYEVITAPDGEGAIISAKKDKPDIILLDLMMPKMNGVETLKILKNDADTKNIPVIILTNLADSQDDMKKSKEMGALDYLVKSETTLQMLTEKIEKALAMTNT